MKHISRPGKYANGGNLYLQVRKSTLKIPSDDVTKHIEQWRRTLKNLAGPIIGHLSVDHIDTALVMRCIEPIWTNKTETASRLRGRIEAVLGRTGVTVHGFRSTFRDWCAGSTNYPADVAEMAPAHTLRDRTEAAYRRGDLLEKRARLMADWARYCSKPAAPAKVIAIRRGTRIQSGRCRFHHGIGPPGDRKNDGCTCDSCRLNGGFRVTIEDCCRPFAVIYSNGYE